MPKSDIVEENSRLAEAEEPQIPYFERYLPKILKILLEFNQKLSEYACVIIFSEEISKVNQKNHLINSLSENTPI